MILVASCVEVLCNLTFRVLLRLAGVKRFMRHFAFPAAIFLLTSIGSAQVVGHHAAVPVPFIGCPADGQLGPKAPPKQTTKAVRVSPDLAVQLAWYQGSYGQGVLAPRGWHCLATYGSNGATTYVTPQQLTGSQVLSSTWRGLDGPAIQLSDMSGGTSGRFYVAEAISRLFPAFRGYLAGQDFGTMKFPSGPYPTDKLHYLNDHTVEYIAAAHQQGLGTESRLVPGNLPISGVMLLTGSDTDLVALSIRLQNDSDPVARAISLEVEHANRTPPAKP